MLQGPRSIFAMTHLGGFEVDKDMVIFVDRMSIRVRTSTSSLKVLPTNETSIDIDVRQRDGTNFLKVKV